MSSIYEAEFYCPSTEQYAYLIVDNRKDAETILSVRIADEVWPADTIIARITKH